MSIREFCRRRRLKECQFYWWQRKLKGRREARTLHRSMGSRGGTDVAKAASFALVSNEDGESIAAGIELVLADGRRLRIGRGVDEETFRTVLGVLEQGGC